MKITDEHKILAIRIGTALAVGGCAAIIVYIIYKMGSSSGRKRFQRETTHNILEAANVDGVLSLVDTVDYTPR